MIKAAVYSGLLASAFLLTADAYAAAKVSQEQLTQLEQQAIDRRMEAKKLQAQAVQLSLELAKLNKKLINAARRLQNDEDKATKAEAELKLLEDKLRVAQDDFNRENTTLASTLASLQNLALHPGESLLLRPLDPVDVIRSAVLLRESVPFLSEKAAKIKKDLDQISAQKKVIEQKLQKLAAQKESILKQQQEIKKSVTQKNTIRKKIEGESSKTSQEAAKLAAEASDLRELMEKLEHDKQLRKRRQEELRRAAREREEAAQRKLEEEQRERLQKGEGSGLATESGEKFENYASDEDMDLINLKPQRIKSTPTHFAGARGRLSRPARGPIITAYGQELSKGVTSKGIIIKTRPAAQVIAPYDGSVIFSGPFKGYGNLIIIEHGEGYVSLLAGMEMVDAETGQMVLAGEPLGSMPETDTAKLYMEIRKDKRPVNPVPWLEG